MSPRRRLPPSLLILLYGAFLSLFQNHFDVLVPKDVSFACTIRAPENRWYKYDCVSVSFARSGGPGGQNVDKVNTKVDMRFNVQYAYWLSDRVRERIMQMEKNRIYKDGEIVISSTKTRTQKGNIEDALEKLQVGYEKLTVEIFRAAVGNLVNLKGVWNIAFYGEKDSIKRKRKKDPKGFKVPFVATRRHLFMEGLMKCLKINEILYGLMQFIDGHGHI